MKSFWLMKSEPDVYSIDDLARDGVEPWTGVRNYQARNYLRDAMQPGDLALFYHSNATPPGVVGLMRVDSEAQPDATALDPQSEYFDPKSSPEHPIWVQRRMVFVSKFPRMLTLDALRNDPALQDMLLLRKGQRLSVQPVEEIHFRRICDLAGTHP
jgi:predicted RNA-binding protein with PUA-like domain